MHASETAPAHGFRGQHRSKTICAGADSPDLHSLLSKPAHVERNLEFVQLMLLLADGRVDALHNGKLAKCQRQAQNLCMQRRSAALRCSFQRRYRAVDTAHNTGGIIGKAPLPVGSSVPGRRSSVTGKCRAISGTVPMHPPVAHALCARTGSKLASAELWSVPLAQADSHGRCGDE